MKETDKCCKCGCELIDDDNCCYEDFICDDCYEAENEEEEDDE
jgi:hypothetical protein